MAIATGKNINFPSAPYTPGVPQDFGTDGGVHNFLRFLESWGGKNIYYKGSMASMYYSVYATGVFKCCTSVYGAPTRNYAFDLDFRTCRICLRVHRPSLTWRTWASSKSSRSKQLLSRLSFGPAGFLFAHDTSQYLVIL